MKDLARSLSFVIRVNLLHPQLSLFLYGLVLSLVFFNPSKLLFLGFLQFKSSFVRASKIWGLQLIFGPVPNCSMNCCLLIEQCARERMCDKLLVCAKSVVSKHTVRFVCAYTKPNISQCLPCVFVKILRQKRSVVGTCIIPARSRQKIQSLVQVIILVLYKYVDDFCRQFYFGRLNF